MSTISEARAVELLLEQSIRFFKEGRFADALHTAEKASAGAQRLGDVGLQVRAARLEAGALELLGRHGDALTRYSWILGIAENPAHRAALAGDNVAQAVVTAFMSWSNCALYLPAMRVDQLFQVLDAGERFTRAIGKPTWRAGLLQMRAKVLQNLGRVEEAIGFAEEGLALELRDRHTPGPTLGTHRWGLGDLLRDANRFDDARRLYKAVLDDADAGPYDRFIALRGLHAGALAAKETSKARPLAEEAVRLAEPMGDEALSGALEDLTNSCLALGDLPAARAASDRHTDLARNLGGPINLLAAYYCAAKVALAERDAPRARAHLAEAQPHAEALDRARNRNFYRAMLDTLRTQLEALDPPPTAT